MAVCTKDMKTVATYTEQPDAVQDHLTSKGLMLSRKLISASFA